MRSATTAPASTKLLIDLIEIILRNQNLTRLRAIGRSDDAVRLEHVDDPGRSAVPETKAALQVRDRSLSRFHDDARRLVVQLVLLERLDVVRFLCLENGFIVLGTALASPESNQPSDLRLPKRSLRAGE